MDIYPITLTGASVRLEPLSEAHVSGLAAVGLDPSLWQYYPFGGVDSVESMATLVRSLLAAQQKGTDLPFTVLNSATSQVIGMTRYLDIQPRNRALEIGGTWYAAAFQRTAANTECKYLLLRHAFETLGCLRVQFKTDLRNERSQRAIERIGATREGVLRNHMLLPNGTMRSSMYFSILSGEWPEIKTRLELMLANR
jgi:RimJ/RimL family protein N-acetyltransferase